MGQYDTSAQPPRSGGASPHVGNGNGAAGRDLGHEAAGEARRVADQAKEGVRQRIDSQREAGASTVDGVAEAVRSAADRLDQDQPELAQYTREAARMAEQVSEAIRTRSLGDIVRSADSFARREPVAFFGAALVAGFAVSRFLASSSRHTYDRPGDDVASRMASGAGERGYRSGYGSGYGGRDDMDDRFRRSGMGNAGSGSSAASDYATGPIPRSAASSFGETGRTGSTTGPATGSMSRTHEGISGTSRSMTEDSAFGAGSRTSGVGGATTDTGMHEPPERPEVRKGPDTVSPTGRSTAASAGATASETKTAGANRSTITGSGTTPTSLSKGSGSGSDETATPSRTGRPTDPDR